MRRFSFRLEPFLRIRTYREKTAELELAKAVATCVTLQGHIQDVKRELQANTACSIGGILYDFSDLQARNAYRMWLERDLHLTQERLTIAEIERKKKQEQYLSASRDRKVLEKLKERKAEEYYDEQWNEEFNRMDEIADRFVLQAKMDEGRE
ncbi:MAG: flagellar export protein FliJ [Spirochaetes bacterium]|nr:flagellar export protein FliJ [Spirochaetota bacterium]